MRSGQMWSSRYMGFVAKFCYVRIMEGVRHMNFAAKFCCVLEMGMKMTTSLAYKGPLQLNAARGMYSCHLIRCSSIHRRTHTRLVNMH